MTASSGYGTDSEETRPTDSQATQDGKHIYIKERDRETESLIAFI